jgi:hypothetical protein
LVPESPSNANLFVLVMNQGHDDATNDIYLAVLLIDDGAIHQLQVRLLLLIYHLYLTKRVLVVCMGLGDLHISNLDGIMNDRLTFIFWNSTLEADPMVRSCILEATATKMGAVDTRVTLK